MVLAIIMSNRCNLLCDYCLVLLNKGKPLYLTFEQMSRGIECYLQGRDPDQCAVVYLGGEPLLRPDLLLETAAWLRRTHPAVRQEVSTNGVLLTPELFSELAARDVAVRISIDGDRRSHDRHRVHYGSPQPSWDGIQRRLSLLPLEVIRASAVVTAETAEELAENVDFLRRRGFRSIDLSLDLCDARIDLWDASAISRLRRGAVKLAALLRSVRKTAPEPGARFAAELLESLAPRPAEDFESVLLGADGGFYPCETLLGFPYESVNEFRIGGIDVGVDWEKRRRLASEARARVRRDFGDEKFLQDPLKICLYAARARRDPRPMIQTMRDVLAAAYDPLKTLVEESAATCAPPADGKPGR